MSEEKRITKILQLTKFMVKDENKYKFCMNKKNELVKMQLNNILFLPKINRKSKSINTDLKINKSEYYSYNPPSNKVTNSIIPYNSNNTYNTININQAKNQLNFNSSTNIISQRDITEFKHNITNLNKSTNNNIISYSPLSSYNIKTRNLIKIANKTHSLKGLFSNRSMAHIKKVKIRPHSRVNLFQLNDTLIDTNVNYNNLKYDESEIYYNKNLSNPDDGEVNIQRISNFGSFIDKNIDSRDNLIDFISNNFTIYKEKFPMLNLFNLCKEVHKDKTNEINIELNTIKISFSNMKKEQNYLFEIPFFFAPLFYTNPSEKIPQLLLALIKINYKENKEIEITLRQGDELHKLIEYYSENEFHLHMLNSIQDEASIQKNQYTHTNFFIFRYLWITSNTSFEVLVHLPSICFHFNKTNTTIKKYIDKKMFLYLYKKDFDNWDYYIINYFYSFKDIRKIIDAISSKIPQNLNSYTNKTFDMSNKNNIKEYNLYDEVIKFLLTSEGSQINYILNIYSFSLEMRVSKRTNNYFNPIFYFNFMQLLLLLNLHNRIDYLEFLLRFVEENKTGFTFRYDNFNSISKDNIILLFQNKSLQKKYCPFNETTYFRERKLGGKLLNPKLVLQNLDCFKNGRGRKISLSKQYNIDIGDFFQFKDEKDVYKWGRFLVNILYQEIDKEKNDNGFGENRNGYPIGIKGTFHKKRISKLSFHKKSYDEKEVCESNKHISRKVSISYVHSLSSNTINKILKKK